MNYVDIKNLDVGNGFGINVSVYFSGCKFHCLNCQNKDFWDFNCGYPWTKEVEDQVIEYVKYPYVKHLCILGGEPLQQDLTVLRDFIIRVKKESGKDVLMWTGYTWETILKDPKRLNVVRECKILIDGQFVQEEKDLTLSHKGSRNQREINVEESLKKNSIILMG